MSASPRPRVASSEVLARFITESGKFNQLGPHWKLFRPPGSRELSTSRICERTPAEMDEAAARHASERGGKHYGYAKIPVAEVEKVPGLSAFEDPIEDAERPELNDPYHALILGWSEEPDAIHQACMALAAASTHVRALESSSPTPAE